MKEIHWFRYEETYCPDMREMKVHEMHCEVLNTTAFGVQLRDIRGRRRFVLRASHKRYACPTRAEAMASYKARKTRQVAILSAQLRRAKRALNMANEGVYTAHFEIESVSFGLPNA